MMDLPPLMQRGNEVSREDDEAVVEEAIAAFTEATTNRRFEEAAQAVAVAVGVASLVEAEDPLARSRW